jgi:DNA-binding NarL/FixJ family response regulator
MLKILVVDDNADFRAYFKAILAEALEGAVIAEAENAAEAMRKYALLKPDVILLDIDLGEGINGFQLMEVMRRLDAHSEIIILTGHDLPEYRAMARAHGAGAFLSKASCSKADIRAAARKSACRLDKRYC